MVDDAFDSVVAGTLRAGSWSGYSVGGDQRRPTSAGVGRGRVAIEDDVRFESGGLRSGGRRVRTAPRLASSAHRRADRRTEQMQDPLGAFVPHGRVEIAGAARGPLSGATFAVKDIFDVAGTVTGRGNPDWLASHGPAAANAPAVQALLDAGARLVGKTVTEELAFSVVGSNPYYGTPTNVAAPGRVGGGSSSGSAAAVGGGLVGSRAGQRHRRLGARAGELLRDLRHAADPWPDQPRRRHAAGAELRHGRLVRARPGAVPRPPGGSCSATRRRAGGAGRVLLATRCLRPSRARDRGGAAARDPTPRGLAGRGRAGHRERRRPGGLVPRVSHAAGRGSLGCARRLDRERAAAPRPAAPGAPAVRQDDRRRTRSARPGNGAGRSATVWTGCSGRRPS